MTALTTENLILLGAVLLFLSIIASKTSGRLGVPSLIIFMAIGMLAGIDGIGKIPFNDFEAIQKLGTLALIFILFSGGVDTKMESVGPVMWKGVTLATLGVIVTAGITGIFVWKFTDFSLFEGLLLGSIISSTDAAAVFSILRSKNIGLRGRLRPLLELESGSNDPMAYFLTVSFIQLITLEAFGFWNILLQFIIQMSLGLIYGFIMGKASVWIINRIKLDYEGLYPVMVLALVLFTYAMTAYGFGNGFLAVYVMAVVLGNSSFIHKKSLMKFYDGQAWLMQIIMFIALGLLVNPHEIIPIIGVGLLVSMFLIIIARPLGVFASLVFFGMKFREMLFISWVGLRGAVPIIFATFAVTAGIEKSTLIFNIVFFIVITSVALQGTTLMIVARWLHLDKNISAARHYPLELELTDGFRKQLVEVSIPDDCPMANKPIVDIGFPRNALIVMIERNKQYITPNGSTIIRPGDNLLVLTNSIRDLQLINACLQINQV
ncbi:MAG TPA: potassium/proton antiporter [Lentimicrobium sp.]|nr:potassium/proton antiporter [Lentimicrobium sp.]